MDTRLQPYVDRLANEWAIHGKISIGWDWDSTLSPYHTFNNPDDIKRAIALAIDCQLVGCYNVINTACKPDRYDEIRAAAEKMGIRVDTFNRTPNELSHLEYGKEGSKPYCNHFVDDRAALPSSLDILEEAMYSQRAKKYGDKTNYPGWSGL